MKNKKPNTELVWKEIEDLVVPRLRLSVIDRVVYSHLLRHSRLEGKLRLRFSILRVARAARTCTNTARSSVRRLIAHGALRLIERSKAGHLVAVCLPEEIRAARAVLRPPVGRCRAVNLENMDFLKTGALRRAIHARELGHGFYCLSRLNKRSRCLDHVVPLARFGSNSYRNLVSCCMDRNSYKGQRPADSFLRWLYRERRLAAAELTTRLRALDALASGKLPPPLPKQGNTGSPGS